MSILYTVNAIANLYPSKIVNKLTPYRLKSLLLSLSKQIYQIEEKIVKVGHVFPYFQKMKKIIGTDKVEPGVIFWNKGSDGTDTSLHIFIKTDEKNQM